MKTSDDLNEYVDRMIQYGQSHIKQYNGESATECDECGVPIPKARREAVLGTQYCVNCAELFE